MSGRVSEAKTTSISLPAAVGLFVRRECRAARLVTVCSRRGALRKSLVRVTKLFTSPRLSTVFHQDPHLFPPCLTLIPPAKSAVAGTRISETLREHREPH